MNENLNLKKNKYSGLPFYNFTINKYKTINH
jgi:hypothetical protein